MPYFTQTSTIADGNMSFRYGEKAVVLDNRRRFIENLGLNAARCVVMDSPHEDIVTIINGSESTEHYGLTTTMRADSLITQLPDTPLLLTTADCLPITLHDATTNTLALMHLSRHTFCLHLIPKTIAVLNKTLNVTTSNLEVIIGPHIHKTSYSFPLPLMEVHPKLMPYVSYTNTHAYIDLARAAIESFKKLGVTEDHIQVSERDTYSDMKYFSHVRSVQTGEPEGRLMTVACLTT